RYLTYVAPHEYSTAGTPELPVAMPWMDLVTIAELRDPEAFDETLANLPGQISTWKYDGQQVFWVSAEVSAIVNTSLYFARVDKEVIVTFQPQVMKDAIDAWKHPEKSLTETPEFAEVQKSLPAETCFLLYFPPGGFAKGVIDACVPQIQTVSAMIAERFAAY